MKALNQALPLFRNRSKEALQLPRSSLNQAVDEKYPVKEKKEKGDFTLTEEEVFQLAFAGVSRSFDNTGFCFVAFD